MSLSFRNVILSLGQFQDPFQSHSVSRSVRMLCLLFVPAEVQVCTCSVDLNNIARDVPFICLFVEFIFLEIIADGCYCCWCSPIQVSIIPELLHL